MGNINFRPWVGSKYQAEGLHGKKILVLGESHHCEKELSKGGGCFPFCKIGKMKDDCHSFTEDVLDSFIYNYSGEPYQQTFLCFERAVMGKELTQDEREYFWDRIVFYNYIQFAVSGARVAPQSEHWSQSEKAFRELLEEYMPDYIVVWGVRLYDNLPDWGGTHSVLSIDETHSTDVWTYNINGKKIPAIKVHHPSSSTGKAWKYWHKFYVNFLHLQ